MVTRFSGKRWTIPSRLYSDSMTIYPGQRLSDIGFFERLARLNYHRVAAGAEVEWRGDYCYDQKSNRRDDFPAQLLAIPIENFPGELIEIKLAADRTRSNRSRTA